MINRKIFSQNFDLVHFFVKHGQEANLLTSLAGLAWVQEIDD